MEYIVDFKPYIKENIDISYYSTIEEKISSNKSITQAEAENFLQTISYIIRKTINPNMDNFDYKCDLAQSILGNYLEKINCKYAPCATQNVITAGVEGHSFTTVMLNVEGEEKTYLVDPTYIQFFHKDKCQLSNYFISPLYPDRILLTPNPGFFIRREDQEASEFLLKYGYIELTEEYARMYGDSFLNTKTGENPNNLEFKTIPGSVYQNAFTKGRESLSKTDSELTLEEKNITPFQELSRTSQKVI